MKTTIARCRVAKAAALLVLLAMAGETARAVDPIPDWLTLVFPVAVPKAGHPSEIPTDRRANHIKALYDDMFEAYWRETSYHEYDPVTGATTRGIFVDSRTFNYIMMPWPISARDPIVFPEFPDGTTEDTVEGGRRHSEVILARAGDGTLVVPFAFDGADFDGEWTPGESFQDANGNNQFDPYSYGRTYRPAEDRWNSDNNLARVQLRDAGGAALGTLFFPSNRQINPANGDGYSATGGEMFADYNHNADLANDDPGYDPAVTIYVAVGGAQTAVPLNELDLTPLDATSVLEGDLAHTVVVDAEPAVGPNPPNSPLGGVAPLDVARNQVLDYTTTVNDNIQIVRALFTTGAEAYTEYPSYVRSDVEPDDGGFYRYEHTWKGTGAPPAPGPDDDWTYVVHTIRVNIYQARELYGEKKFETPTGNAYGDVPGGDRTQVEDNAWTPGEEVITEINGEPFEDFLSWYDPDQQGMTWLSELPPNYAPVITNATGTIIVNNPSPQIGNADDNGNWNRRGREIAIDWLEYERYIRWNYPGDADALLARAFSGMYDGPEDYISRANNKLTPVPVDDVLTMQPMSVAGATLLDPPNHWDDRFYPTWQDWWNDAFATEFGVFETDGGGVPILDPFGNPIPLYDRGGVAYTIDQDLITGFAIPVLDGMGDPVYETDADGNIGLDANGNPIPLYQGIPDGNLVLDPDTFIAQQLTVFLPATPPMEWNETVYDAEAFSPDDGPDEDGWIPATSWAYSTTREFCDLPSTLYHLRDGVGAFVLGAGRDPLTGYLGGDEAFGEVTSPFNTEIYGQDLWTMTMDGGSRETQDGLITPASPFAYQINGVHGADAGNLATLEYMTWRRDGDPLVDIHPLEFRDRNLDGRMDIGYTRSGEAAYSTEDDPDGTGPYPYNRERFMEDVIAIWDYSEDFSVHTNRLTGARIPFYGFPNYLPQATAPVAGGGEDEEEVIPGWGSLGGPAGANVDVMTLDDVEPYHIVFQVRPQDGGTIGGAGGIEIEAPDVAGSSFGIGILLHEQGHDIIGWPDLYDYDVSSEGEVINEPIGGYDLMAGGLVHGVGDLKWSAGWTSLTNLNVVVPVNTDPVWIEMYPVERYAHNYFRFSNPVRPGEYLDLWYTQNNTRFGVPGGAGVYISHVDKGGNPLALPRQQRVGNHFIWQMVQADGLQHLEDNVNGGDGGDPFPGSTGNRLFTEFTTPASRWFDGAATGLRIYDIELPTTFGEPARVLIGQANPLAPLVVDPRGPDSDNDGIPDAWEFYYFGRLDIVNATSDYDGDGLLDLHEYLAAMNPRMQDTNGNGTPDRLEDPDNDSLSNLEEQNLGTHSLLPDSSDDGLWDGVDPNPIDSLIPQVDRVLQLAGLADSYVEMSAHRRYALPSFTIQAWVNPTALGGTLIERQPQAGASNYALRVTATGQVELAFTPVDLSAEVVLTTLPGQVLQVGRWTHVAASFDAATGRMSIFFDGVQRATMITPRRPVTTEIGAAWTRAGAGFSGMLDEVAIFSSALPAATILTAIEGIFLNPPAGLVSYYRFDDGTSAELDPLDPQGRHFGTSARADWWWGQVEDFAPGFEDDWLRNWRNAGTLFGDVAMSAAPADAPVRFDVTDSNGDGIPDWWYDLNGLDPAGPSVADEDWDNDGLPNYWEFRLNSDPNNPYSLDPDGVLMDAEWDSDGDGLSNLDEVLVWDTDPTDPDTDDDGVTDGDEVDFTIVKADGRTLTSPVYSRSPLVQRSLVLDGTAVRVPAGATRFATDRFDVATWTLEAWVRPATGAQTGSLVKRVVDATGRTAAELRLDANIPKVRFQTAGGSWVTAGGSVALPAGEWTHLAGVWDPAAKSLALYVNGVSYRAQATTSVPVSGKGTTTIGAGVNGYMDEARLWSVARTAAEIAASRDGIINTPELVTGLIASYRFDDNGATAEDFTRPLDWDFALTGVVMTGAEAVPLLGMDDALEDGIPDWWQTLFFGPPAVDDGSGGGTTPDPVDPFANWTVATAPIEPDDSPIGLFPQTVRPDDAYLLIDTELTLPPLPAEHEGKTIEQIHYRVTTQMTEVALISPRFAYSSPHANGSSAYPDRGGSLTLAAVGGSSVRAVEQGGLAYWGSLRPGFNRIVVALRSASGVDTGSFDMNIEITGVSVMGGSGIQETIVYDTPLVLLPYGADGWMLYTDPLVTTVPPNDSNGNPWWHRYFGLTVDEIIARGGTAPTNPTDPTDPGSSVAVYPAEAQPDADPDGDTLTNDYEYSSDTNPLDADTDNDGALDTAEDAEGDGLQNLQEQTRGSHPRLADTDDDRRADGQDVHPADGLAPLKDRVLDLDGAATSFVELPRQTRFALPSYTVQAWINPAVGGGDIIARQTQAGVYNYALRLNGLRPEIVFTPGDGTANVVLTAPAAQAIPAGTWAHVAGTFDAATGRLSLFINGVQAATVTTSKWPATNGVGPERVRIGAGFTGQVDETAIFSTALTPAAITALMPGIGAAGPEGLVSYYRFDDDTSAVGPDANGFWFGTAGHTAWWWGQVQEFASGYDQDWLQDWRNAGTLRGQAAMVVAPADAPIDLAGADSNGDGIPDWWYIEQGLDPTGPSVADEDWDGDGISNFWEYRLGLDPHAKDSDGNGVEDQLEDSDGDGLGNADEIAVGSDPSDPDTDDDGVLDGVEMDALVAKADGRTLTSPVYSRSPEVNRSLVLNGAAVRVPAGATRFATDRFDSSAWTLEAWVRPATGAQTGSLVKRVVDSTGRTAFELRLDGNVPKVRFQNASGIWVTAGGTVALPVAEWTHLAGVWNPVAKSLSLYVNGVSYRSQATTSVPVSGKGTTTIGGGVQGHLDEVRLWSAARTAAQVADGRDWLVNAPYDTANLIANYRFDDGGLTAEDHVQPLDWDYALNGVVMTGAQAVPLLGMDDSEEDGLPDWWQSLFWAEYEPTAAALDGPLAAIRASAIPSGWRNSTGPIGEEGDTSALQVAPDSAWILKDVYVDFPAGVLNAAWGTPASKAVTSWDLAINWPNSDNQFTFNVYVNGALVGTGSEDGPLLPYFTWNGTGTIGGTYDNALFVSIPGVLEIGRNRIAIEVINESTDAQNQDLGLDFAIIDVNLRAEYGGAIGTKTAVVDTLFDFGATWALFGANAVSVPPPNDANERVWSDALYGTNPGDLTETGDGDSAGVGLFKPGDDPDFDGLTNTYEYQADTNPRASDSNNNGALDTAEDADGDGLQNVREQARGSHPRLTDTDDDGRADNRDVHPASSLASLVDCVLQLDGAWSSYVSMPRQLRFGLGSFTLQAWVNPAAAGGQIIVRQVEGGVFNYLLRLSATGRPELVFTPGDRTANVVLTAPASSTLTAGTWAHVAGTFNAATGRLSLHVNGIQVATMTTTKRPATNGVGPEFTRAGAGFAGMIDEVAIFNTALTPTIITSLLPGIGGSAPSGLVSYYRFDDDTSAIGPDANGFWFGTAGNPAWWWGQVQEFASGYDQDWLQAWRNAGTLRGQANIVDAPEGAPDLSDADSNGDGIPDWWYVEQDLDPAGPSVAKDDWDEDKLPNYWEWFFNLDPNNRDTDGNGVSDLHDVASDPRFTDDLDMDGIEDRYEASRDDILDPLVADGHLDHDNDGWNSEMEYLAALLPDGTMAVTPEPDPEDLDAPAPVPVADANDMAAYPRPALTLEIQYNRPVGGAPIVVVAYDNALMNGDQAVATFVIPEDQVTGVYPLTVTLNTPEAGRLVGRPLWFMAFMDNSGDGLIQSGEEPMGFGEGDPQTVGFASVGPVRITLTDQAPTGFARIVTPEDLAGLVNPRFVVRRLSNPATVFVDRVIRDRTILWDRDFEAAGYLNGLPDSAVAGSYGWFIYTNNTVTAPAASGTFVVNYGNRVPAAPTTFALNGDQWRHSRNPVSFSVDGISVRYTLQVLNLSGAVVYTETARLPGAGVDGRIRLIPSVYAGFRVTGSFPMLPNGSYRWRVRTMNGVGEGAWSALRTVMVNVDDAVDGPFSIRGDLFYQGRMPNGLMVVEAFAARDFSGRPVARTTVRMNTTKRVPFSLRGLPAGVHYVRAFQDQNGDAILQPHESRGIIDTMTSMFYPAAITVGKGITGPTVTGRVLVVRDRDSDADLMPDAWELWLAGSMTTMGRGTVRGWTDTNGNGINDYEEYVLGNNPIAGAAATWDAGYVALGANWRRLDWFGDYVPVGGGWFWHGRFGYFFVAGGSTPDQIYLYSPGLNWLYTRKGLYPYLYRFSDGAWLWYQRSSSSPRWFLNLNTSLWESR